MLNTEAEIAMPDPSVMEAADIECKAQLQKFLSKAMPNYLPAIHSATLAGGILSRELTDEFIPKDSFRCLKALAAIPPNLQTKCLLKLSIRVFQTYSIAINHDHPTRMICCRPESERSGIQAQTADLYLICFTDSPGIYAVVPSTHLNGGYPGPGGRGPIKQQLPHLRLLGEKVSRALTVFQPYIVPQSQLAPFLQDIYNHAKSNRHLSPIKNPTTGLEYTDFQPSLGDLALLGPPNNTDSHLAALHTAFEALNGAFKLMQTPHPTTTRTFHLIPTSPSTAHSSFLIAFHTATWTRTPHNTIQLTTRIPTGPTPQDTQPLFHHGTAWDYLLAKSADGNECLFLPRDCIPQGWWEHTGNPVVEIGVEMWDDFAFPSTRDMLAVARKMEHVVVRYGKPRSVIPDPPDTVGHAPLVNVSAMMAHGRRHDALEVEGESTRQARSVARFISKRVPREESEGAAGSRSRMWGRSKL